MRERIWAVQGLPPSGESCLHDQFGASFPNVLVVSRELGRDDQEGPFMHRSPWPAASALEVIITDADLVLDWWALPLGPVVSARMREAWAGADHGIEYRPVDASGSCAKAQVADYRLMHVMAEESVIDPARSDYDSSAALSWLPEGFPTYVRSLGVREDAAPKHSVFRDAFVRNYLFCTDMMALRALQAGCTGVRFLHPATQYLMRPIRYRTLDGVAEISDAALARGESERFVERIP
jgi:hypothetical protein